MPTAPTNVVALPLGARMDVSWQPPTRTGGSALSAYEVEVRPGSLRYEVPATQTSIRLGVSMRYGLEYRVRVRAQNGILWGPFSVPSAPFVLRPACAQVPFDAGRIFVNEDPGALVLRDMDEDGKTDVVVVNRGYVQSHVSVLPSGANGPLGPRVDHPTARGAMALVVADVTGDGLDDLVTAHTNVDLFEYNPPMLAYLRALGGGTYAPPVELPLPPREEPRDLLVADVNSDGHQDLQDLAALNGLAENSPHGLYPADTPPGSRPGLPGPRWAARAGAHHQS